MGPMYALFGITHAIYSINIVYTKSLSFNKLVVSPHLDNKMNSLVDNPKHSCVRSYHTGACTCVIP